jgi:LysM repeat protein/ABC-type branched-subunit amino acid transport system substrate-binding protein
MRSIIHYLSLSISNTQPALISRVRLWLFCFLLVPALSQTVLAQDIAKSNKIEKFNGKKYYIHTVTTGQTLFGIAKAYALETSDIILENPTAMDGIKPGQELKIPFGKSVSNEYAAPDKGKVKTHKAEAGQTLYSISKLYGVTVYDLVKLNPELKDGLKAGQVIKIPSSDKAPEEKTVSSTPPEKPSLVKSSPAVTAKNTPDNKVVTAVEPKVTAPAAEILPVGDTVFVMKKQDKYTVALFAPFHYDNADNVDVDRITRDLAAVPPKTEESIQFDTGFKLAADSLRKAGLHLELYVYDIDDMDSARIQETLRKPELLDVSLIIGPLSPGAFMPVAKFAHKKNIAIVSPVSQQNKVLLNNDCVSKMTPSVSTELEGQGDYIFKNNGKDRVVLIANANPKEATYTSIFRNHYNTLLNKNGRHDSLLVVKGADALIKNLSLTQVNVLVMPSNSQAYVTDMLRTLNTLLDKYQIILYGMPSWSGFALDLDYLNKLHLHYTAQSFVDYENESTLNFIKNYRLASGTEPGVHAFQGYDAGYYFLNALQQYGVNFRKKLPMIKWNGTQSAMDFYRTSAESGLENKAVNILEIADFKLIRSK